MQVSISLTDLLVWFAGVLALVSIAVAIRMRREVRFSPFGMAVAVLPPVTMFGLFYTLAIHMHQVLGGWPASIGNRGFPTSLVTHQQIALEYTTALFMVSIFGWPVAFLLSVAVRRYRVWVPYLALYAVLFLVCYGSMFLAPRGFQNWWWD